MLEQLSNCIKKIFQSTEFTESRAEETEIIGKSLTDPYSYGLVIDVMGKSLTDFSLAEVEETTIYPSEVTWIDLDDDDENAIDSIPGMSEGIEFNDFNKLESELENETVLGTVSKLKGSVLYDRLKENSETRSKISSLLSKVGSYPDSGSLRDMSDFLETNIV